MKKIMILMLMMGLVSINACTSYQANVKADDSASEIENDKAIDDVIAELKRESKKEVKKDKVLIENKVMSKTPEGFKNRVSVCKNGKHVRTISVIYKKNVSVTSCDVTYEKVSGVKTLWNAKSDLAYCLKKAKEFVRKQEGWGWSCSDL